MEIYDKAHELEAAIKECQEYKDLVAAGQELAKDEKTKHLVRDFLMLQAQLAHGGQANPQENRPFEPDGRTH